MYNSIPGFLLDASSSPCIPLPAPTDPHPPNSYDNQNVLWVAKSLFLRTTALNRKSILKTQIKLLCSRFQQCFSCYYFLKPVRTSKRKCIWLANDNSLTMGLGIFMGRRKVLNFLVSVKMQKDWFWSKADSFQDTRSWKIPKWEGSKCQMAYGCKTV